MNTRREDWLPNSSSTGKSPVKSNRAQSNNTLKSNRAQSKSPLKSHFFFIVDRKGITESDKDSDETKGQDKDKGSDNSATNLMLATEQEVPTMENYLACISQRKGATGQQGQGLHSDREAFNLTV